MKKYFLSDIVVSENKKITDNFFKMSIIVPKIAPVLQPGQFVNIVCSDDTFLARPFSIAGVRKNVMDIIYKVVGEGTKQLSKKVKGEKLNSVFGPLGSGYPLPLKIKKSKKIVLVGGGTGIASLLFLADRLSRLPNYDLTFLFGFKNKKQLICLNELKNIKKCSHHLCTEDGSLGTRGLVTDMLEKVLKQEDTKILTVYSCGPKPMLKTVAQITKKYNVHCYISLEEKMACGVGACKGCVTNTQTGYKSVCKDGPVFDAREIIWQ